MTQSNRVLNSPTLDQAQQRFRPAPLVTVDPGGKKNRRSARVTGAAGPNPRRADRFARAVSAGR